VATVRTGAQLRASLTRLAREQLYLHVDLDVLDPSSLQANQFATADGLSTTELMECVEVAANTKQIAAVAITAYDPDADAANAGPAIVLEVLRRALVRPA
jgi:arginase